MSVGILERVPFGKLKSSLFVSSAIHCCGINPIGMMDSTCACISVICSSDWTFLFSKKQHTLERPYTLLDRLPIKFKKLLTQRFHFYFLIPVGPPHLDPIHACGMWPYSLC